MQSYVIKVHIKTAIFVIYTATCFEALMSSSGSYNQYLAKVATFL